MRGLKETLCTSGERSVGSTSNIEARTATSAGDSANSLPNRRASICHSFAVGYNTQNRPARMDAARRGTTPRVHITLFLLGGRMQTTEVRTFDAGRRVQGLLDTNAPTIGTAVPPSLRAKFDAAVSQIVQFQHEQDAATAATNGETVNQAALRSDLFKHLVAPVGKVAKINLRQSTDLPALVVAAAVQRRSDFVVKGNTLADTASKYELMFVDHGLPADFIAQIRAGATLTRHRTKINAVGSGRLQAKRHAAQHTIHRKDGTVISTRSYAVSPIA